MVDSNLEEIIIRIAKLSPSDDVYLHKDDVIGLLKKEVAFAESMNAKTQLLALIETLENGTHD